MSRRPRVLVTRSVDQAGPLGELLTAAGCEPVCIPTIAIQPVEDLSLLDRAIRDLDTFQYVVLPSVNGARVFLDRASALGQDLASAGHLRAVAGPATARVLENAGFTPRIVPDPFSAEAALTALKGEPLAGARVLLPRAQEGREALGDGLRASGARVKEVPVYRTVPVSGAPRLSTALTRGELDAVTFFSPSAVRGFTLSLEHARLQRETLTLRPLVACIGMTTATAAAQLGWPADVIAAGTTAEALVIALASALSCVLSATSPSHHRELAAVQ